MSAFTSGCLNAPRALSERRLLISSCGLMTSMSATITDGVSVLIAPTATV